MPKQIKQIFYDPLTEKNPEGEAELLKLINIIGYYKGHKIELWKVRFLDDGACCLRKVKVKIYFQLNNNSITN